MTDDKGAGEGPYKAGQRLSPRDVFPLSIREASLVNCGYAAGRKAERERCAKIVSDHDHECGLVDKDSVLEKIREGQDGE